MPIYEFEEKDYINPPWIGREDEWLYRRVVFQARPKHRFSMYLKEDLHHHPGYQQVIPFVYNEDQNLENQKGLLVNTGWYPEEFKDISGRYRLENSFGNSLVYGVVTKGKHLKRGDFWRRGNAFDEQRYSFNSFDLERYVKSCQLTNPNEAKRVIIQLISPVPYKQNVFNYSLEKDITHTETYPYKQTTAGLLRENSKSILGTLLNKLYLD